VTLFTAEPAPNFPSPVPRRITYAELYALVADLVSAFILSGLSPGDRVASYSSNCIASPMNYRAIQWLNVLIDIGECRCCSCCYSHRQVRTSCLCAKEIII
jgi:hypothetical protein